MHVDILILGFLIAFNGLFAMTELAVVASRKARLQPMAEAGSRGALAALNLHNHPGNFLSTVQVGITIIGVSSGAVGESVIAEPFAAWLAQIPGLARYSHEIALTATIVGITYFSVVVGELVPKRLALRAPETIAALTALPMTWMSRLARPLVWVFSTSSEVLLRIIGAAGRAEQQVSNAEIEVLMEQGAEAGVFHESEQELVSNILRLDEQRVSAIMTPRVDIEHIDLADPPADITATLLASSQNRIVVCRDGLQQVLGVLSIIDLLKHAVTSESLDLSSIETNLREPLFVRRSTSTVHLLEQFRRARQQFALVVGEYGDVQGVVTLTDVLESIVGDLEPDRPAHERDIVVREDGSWLCDGGISIDRFKAELGITDELPGENEDAYYTLGGFVMNALGRVPAVAEYCFASGYRFEVIDMDSNRIDKVLVARLPSTPNQDGGLPA